MTVSHLEDGRFSVPSETDPFKEYIVDVMDNPSHPICTCDYYIAVIEKDMERGVPYTPCKHIECTLMFLGQSVVNHMVRKHHKIVG
jgi:hypothetical protein